jgi:hypothetical protein
MRYVLMAALVLLTGFSTQAQVTIVNPKHLDVPEGKVNILFHMTCEVLGEEFHYLKNDQIEFPAVLILGRSDDYISADSAKGVYAISLEKWDENMFTSAVITLGLYRIVPMDRRRRLVLEARRRSDLIAPVSISELRKMK